VTVYSWTGWYWRRAVLLLRRPERKFNGKATKLHFDPLSNSTQLITQQYRHIDRSNNDGMRMRDEAGSGGTGTDLGPKSYANSVGPFQINFIPTLAPAPRKLWE
jgi:hypothetical protein